MSFLYFLEGIRNPFLDEIMLMITRFGEETAFLIAALILFWCVDKYKGYYILSVGFIGTITNQFLKLVFRIPRPWVLDENFTILEEAREAASGYSFPSGHTQSAVGTFGGIAHISTNKWVRIFSAAIAVLVPFSRMYVGVHTPMDVIVGAAISVLLILLLRPVIFGRCKKGLPVLLCIMTAISIAYVCFVEFFPFPETIDVENLMSGTKNAYTLLGSLAGFLVVYILDEKWLNFSTESVWWAQVLKVIFGLLLVLAVKSGMKEPLNLLFGELAGRAIRYFLIVIVAGTVWPLTFKWFTKLGIKE